MREWYEAFQKPHSRIMRTKEKPHSILSNRSEWVRLNDFEELNAGPELWLFLRKAIDADAKLGLLSLWIIEESFGVEDHFLVKTWGMHQMKFPILPNGNANMTCIESFLGSDDTHNVARVDEGKLRRRKVQFRFW